jgi:hypothetical protein
MATKKTKKSKAPVEITQEVAQTPAAETATPEVASESEDAVKVDMDYLRTTKIHIVVPCNNGTISEAAFISFIKFSNAARQFGLEWSIGTSTNDILLPRAKNTLVSKFLEQPDSTHLMFIDGEIAWEPWHLMVLLNRKVDVIGGLYPTKTIPIRWVVNTFEGAEEGEDGLHEVSRVGSGFMLVKREVFDTLSKHPSVVQYKNEGEVGTEQPVLRTYFESGVKNELYVNDDWNFCDNWRSMGGKIYVDKRVMLSQRGNFSYSASVQDALISSLGQAYLEAMKNAGKIKLIEDSAEATQ